MEFAAVRDVFRAAGMVHPYRPYCAAFHYQGRHSYFLTLVTFHRQRLFTDESTVALVCEQVLRAAKEKQFVVLVYCFMPDHLHLVVTGAADECDLKAFVKLAKQYAGFYYARRRKRQKLWQHGSHDHIVRDAVDLLDRVRYVVNNPVAAGLAKKPEDYPFLGSERWSKSELVTRCASADLRS